LICIPYCMHLAMLVFVSVNTITHCQSGGSLSNMSQDRGAWPSSIAPMAFENHPHGLCQSLVKSPIQCQSSIHRQSPIRRQSPIHRIHRLRRIRRQLLSSRDDVLASSSRIVLRRSLVLPHGRSLVVLSHCRSVTVVCRSVLWQHPLEWSSSLVRPLALRKICNQFAVNLQSMCGQFAVNV
jgi:hypothetical protein